MTSIPSGSNGLNKRSAGASSKSSFNTPTEKTTKSCHKGDETRKSRHWWKVERFNSIKQKYSGNSLIDRLKGDIRLQQQSVGSTNITSDNDYTVTNENTTTVKKEGSIIASGPLHNKINKIFSN